VTKGEKEKLAGLVTKMIEFSNILHPPAADRLIGVISESKDSDILDVLGTHLDYINVYALYQRFDHEASLRDIENLLGIINNEK